MHDLRRQALESGKTVSRKARSRVASATSSKANSTLNSPANSRAASRNPSRQGSDDEEYLSDGTAWSTNSIDDILGGEDGDLAPDAWQAELRTRIEQITNLKRSTTEGRAESLNTFAHILMVRYAKDEVEGHMSELLPSIIRSIKHETTERETTMALRALAVAIVTVDSDTIYETVSEQLKRTISSSQYVSAKVAAIHTLSIAAFMAGVSEEEMLDIMALYLEIIQSDGLYVDAHDEATVVIAALESWGLLATEIDDMEDLTEDAIEAFVEQLDSADAGVQIAAGENIALLYEKSYTPVENDDEVDVDDLDPEDEQAFRAGNLVIKRYTVYRRQDQLLDKLDELAHLSTHRVSKKDKKTLHSSFADVRNSVEKPSRGPKYSTALDEETGLAYGGGRMKVKINGSVELRIDKWWKLQRLNALKRVLQGGFTHHYDMNEAVSRCIPFSMARHR